MTRPTKKQAAMNWGEAKSPSRRIQGKVGFRGGLVGSEPPERQDAAIRKRGQGVRKRDAKASSGRSDRGSQTYPQQESCSSQLGGEGIKPTSQTANPASTRTETNFRERGH